MTTDQPRRTDAAHTARRAQGVERRLSDVERTLLADPGAATERAEQIITGLGRLLDRIGQERRRAEVAEANAADDERRAALREQLASGTGEGPRRAVLERELGAAPRRNPPPDRGEAARRFARGGL